MSKQLEDFIKINKEEFDDVEPSADLWAKIEKNLPGEHVFPKTRQAKTFSLNFVLRVAASLILVMGICFAFYLRSEKKEGIDYTAINAVYAKQQINYASLVEAKRTELKTIAKSDPQLYKEFSTEIARMDSTYNKLNNDLASSPNQELVLRAMIQNLKVQIEVLNQQLRVIELFNKIKQEQKNEIKHI